MQEQLARHDRARQIAGQRDPVDRRGHLRNVARDRRSLDTGFAQRGFRLFYQPNLVAFMRHGGAGTQREIDVMRLAVDVERLGEAIVDTVQHHVQITTRLTREADLHGIACSDRDTAFRQNPCDHLGDILRQQVRAGLPHVAPQKGEIRDFGKDDEAPIMPPERRSRLVRPRDATLSGTTGLRVTIWPRITHAPGLSGRTEDILNFGSADPATLLPHRYGDCLRFRYPLLCGCIRKGVEQGRLACWHFSFRSFTATAFVPGKGMTFGPKDRESLNIQGLRSFGPELPQHVRADSRDTDIE
ncbi:hypothetical protein [Sphingomonas sp. CROZ-RG-20F-R02-07]|uniref:hypothetical protein n=1 Tax=Sphingomonas sp. CROZ-RG-20F-R02-07 TaxID=2914832 RepID=UPI001F566071|nr:hypothetical protein [Sphingomonas sp. CROZ-RG-20F-R02-07]